MSCERTLQELDWRIDEQRQVERQKGGKTTGKIDEKLQN
jgi:hypothetical protein